MTDEATGARDLLPHSAEAEQAVLGALLIDPDAFAKVHSILRPTSFYIERHQYLYAAMAALYEAEQQHTDVVVIREQLKLDGHEEDLAVDTKYLYKLMEDTPTALNVLDYTNIVSQFATQRQMIWTGAQIAELGHKGVSQEKTLSDLLAKASALVDDMHMRRADENGIRTLATLMDKTYDYVGWRMDHQDELSGITTGIDDLDALLDGLQRNNLIIVAARAGMGKTALALHMGEAAARAGHRPLIFSCEMSDQQLGLRMAARAGSLNLMRLRRGALSDKEYKRFTGALADLSTVGMFFDFNPAPSPAYILNRYRQMRATEGVDMIIIDHLNLLKADEKKYNRVLELGAITRSLHRIARVEHTALVCLHQLSRAPEKRESQRPVLSDLRGSGEIEENADDVLFIFRKPYYEQDNAAETQKRVHREKENEDTPGSIDTGLCEIIVSKHRNGPTGTVPTIFDQQTGMFLPAQVQLLGGW
jgi:replicative DNA helicase